MYKAALALGTANQLTNILRDVGEDAVERDRIYVPLDDLAKFGISEREVSSTQVLPGQYRLGQEVNRVIPPCCVTVHAVQCSTEGLYKGRC